MTARFLNICTADGPADLPVCGEVCPYCPIPMTDEGMAERRRRLIEAISAADTGTEDQS